MPIHIPVEYKRHEQDITVQRGYCEFVLEECNHAGAESVEICIGPGEDNGQMVHAPECDKCHAIQNIAGEWS